MLDANVLDGSDSLNAPDWQIGGGVVFGPGGVVGGGVTAGAGSAGSCPTCTASQVASRLPILLIIIVVAVLVLRR